MIRCARPIRGTCGFRSLHRHPLFCPRGRGQLVFFSIPEVLGGRYVVGILRRIFTIYILVR